MNVTRKIARQPVLTEGASVTLRNRRHEPAADTYTVTAVEFIEAGTSRFDFYRIARDRDGFVPAHKFTRTDLVLVSA